MSGCRPEPLSCSTVETRRLRLRAFTPADASGVRRLAGAFEVADTTLNIPHPYQDGMAEAWFASQAAALLDGSGITWAITRLDDRALAGAISLMGIERSHQAELGYWIGVPYWGEGVCTEAGRAVVQHAFDALSLRRLHARCLSRNPASSRVLEKLGFRHEGTLRGHVRKWSVFEDVELYGLVAS